MTSDVKLIVSVDPVAYLRAARDRMEPDPIHYALQAELAGASGIRAHYRLDHRFVGEQDLEHLAQLLKTPFYLQVALHQDVVHLVNQLRPAAVMFSSERREELVTANGLDVTLLAGQLKTAIHNIDTKNIKVFLIVDPQFDQIRMAAKLEAHGLVINVRDLMHEQVTPAGGKRMAHLRDAVRLSSKYGMETHLAGGVSFDRLPHLAAIPGVSAIHLGHSLAARSMLLGIDQAFSRFKANL